MSIIGKLLGGGIGTAADAVGGALDELITSDEERGKLGIEKIKAQLMPIMAAWEERKALAEHSSVFVAGARPALLWVCALAIAYGWVLQPILSGFSPEFKPLPEMGNLVALTTTLYLGRGVEGIFGKKRGKL